MGKEVKKEALVSIYKAVKNQMSQRILSDV